MTRGAVIVIASDGWERDDPSLLAREMARLARTAYAVVWVNPLKAAPTTVRSRAGCAWRCRSSTGFSPAII